MTSPNPNAPKIKFCGFTRHEDLEVACSLGVDAIGLNFYARSPRYVDTIRARELSMIAEGRTTRVGVFVNSTPSEVVNVVEACSLDVVQLHGDEGLDWIAEAIIHPQLEKMPILRALSWRGPSYPEDEATAGKWANHNAVSGLLIDAHDPVQRGGTGKVARWDLLCPRPVPLQKKPFWLAGGLTPQNIHQALDLVRPDGIDLASGIEISPGIKSPELMKLVCEKIRGWGQSEIVNLIS
ncbi:MAG: phosphoribosylanthranilate isomerase [Pirellula sp.]|jgi:phosphoribosylanthranilate isomerase